MTTLIDSSKKPHSDVGTSQSFRLTDKEKSRVDKVVQKHNLDRHVFYRNCVLAQVKLQEVEDKMAGTEAKPNKEAE